MHFVCLRMPRGRHSFSHTYWGWGFQRSYPHHVTYCYERVSVCENYHFDDGDGAWYCFVGS